MRLSIFILITRIFTLEERGKRLRSKMTTERGWESPLLDSLRLQSHSTQDSPQPMSHDALAIITHNLHFPR